MTRDKRPRDNDFHYAESNIKGTTASAGFPGREPHFVFHGTAMITSSVHALTETFSSSWTSTEATDRESLMLPSPATTTPLSSLLERSKTIPSRSMPAVRAANSLWNPSGHEPPTTRTRIVASTD
ncbi:hypothetical protein SEVIR_3G138250v4 [Setaria viridis]